MRVVYEKSSRVLIIYWIFFVPTSENSAAAAAAGSDIRTCVGKEPLDACTKALSSLCSCCLWRWRCRCCWQSVLFVDFAFQLLVFVFVFYLYCYNRVFYWFFFCAVLFKHFPYLRLIFFTFISFSLFVVMIHRFTVSSMYCFYSYWMLLSFFFLFHLVYYSFVELFYLYSACVLVVHMMNVFLFV